MWNFIKKTFWAGVATLFPLFITLYLIMVIFRFADNFVGKHINVFLETHYSLRVPGAGLIAFFVILILSGLLSRFFLGRWIMSFIEKTSKKIPLAANIYPSAKKLSDFLFSDEKNKKKFRKVVLVEFPVPGAWSVGFITNEQLKDFQKALSDEFVCVFVPLAPAPFSGFVYLIPKKKIKEIDMTVDKAIKFVLSGGVVSE